MRARLYSLDALRGIAAIGVVVWHWQHLYFINGTPNNVLAIWESEPLFPVLRTLYTYGWAAVDIFFGISGFVFFWRYRNQVASRDIGAPGFAIRRIARLWPLHLLTLAIVIALQTAFTSVIGHPFIYDHNTLGQLLANLVLAQGWLPGPETFNGPSWSISIEILLYGCFFAICRGGLGDRALPLVIMSCAGLSLWITGLHSQLGRGLMGFFLGGLAYQVVEWIEGSSSARRISLGLIAVAVVGWALTVVASTFPQVHELVARIVHILPHQLDALASRGGPKVLFLGFVWVLVPVTLCACALAEWVLGVSFQRLHLLGDISYSSYLWHFPLQLAVATAIAANPALGAVRSGPGLVAFLVLLLSLSWASYTYLERPAQKALLEGRLFNRRQHQREPAE